ncbi:MAG: TRAP-type C4-dicarboxylate transport system permease small subunit [Granulosicoccus sp.]|jgi:TRAP-type C4-dicarboxylate transport system permease small subunit
MNVRRVLDGLYLWSGYLAAFCLVSIAITIVLQVAGRFVGLTIDSTESAGFFLAGATFLGLAHTFRQGEHIRVTLVTRIAKGQLARILNLWAVGVSIALLLYMTYWAFDLVYFSYKFNDISPGLLAIPFWIPQSVMAIGLLVLNIALIDELVSIIKGQEPSYNRKPII